MDFKRFLRYFYHIQENTGTCSLEGGAQNFKDFCQFFDLYSAETVFKNHSKRSKRVLETIHGPGFWTQPIRSNEYPKLCMAIPIDEIKIYKTRLIVFMCWVHPCLNPHNNIFSVFCCRRAIMIAFKPRPKKQASVLILDHMFADLQGPCKSQNR